MKPTTKTVFISHIHEDDEGLRKLKDLVEQHNMRFRDYSIRSDNPNNAHSENYIKHQILAPRIRQSGSLLVYITPETKDSEYVTWEIEYAEKCGKPIIGVWAYGEHGCEIPDALADYADSIVGWSGKSIISALNGELDAFEDPTGKPLPSRSITRHTCR